MYKQVYAINAIDEGEFEDTCTKLLERGWTIINTQVNTVGDTDGVTHFWLALFGHESSDEEYPGAWLDLV